LADDLRELRRYEQARGIYRYVVDNWADADYAIDCLRGVVRTSMLLGDDPNAEAGISRLLNEFGDVERTGKVLDNIADGYRKSARYEEARRLYKRAAEMWPEAEYAMESKKKYVLCSIAAGDDPNAEAGIDKLITDINDGPELPEAISSIETGYYMRILDVEQALREDYLKAVALWEKIIEKFPDFSHDDPDVYYFVGDCYRHLGEHEKAIHSYGIVAANWAVNGCATVSNVVVPLPDENSIGFDALQSLYGSLLAEYGADAGFAGAILRTGYEYRRLANEAYGKNLSSEAELNNFRAIAFYEQVINEFPGSPFTASAYFFAALSYRDLEHWEYALECCDDLLNNWPEYKYAGWARDVMEDCSERLAGQVQ